MFTQCPQCLTYFQVTPEHLKIAQGNVRCGQCRNVFSALGNLTELPPDGAPGAMTHRPPGKLSRIFEDNGRGSFNTFENDLDESNTSQGINATQKQGLSAAIAAMNRLNRGSLASLTDGKEDIINRLKKSKTIPPPRNAGSQALAVVPQPTPSTPKTIARIPQAIPANPRSERVQPVPPAPVPRARPKKKSTAKVRPVAKPRAPAKKKKAVRKKAVTRPAPQPLPRPISREIDVDEALLAIDELDISQDLVPIQQRQASQQNEVSYRQTGADQGNVDSETEVRKVKRLDRSVPKRTSSVVPRTESSGTTALQVIPKPLLEDFQRAQASDHPELSKGLNVWIVGSVALMFVFLAQTIYYKHDGLAQISSLRPWIVSFCEHASCDISLPFEERKLELLGQDIRSHPKIQKALLVSVTIINNAKHSQAYPGLQITFTDMNDQKIAMRRFIPFEYLSSASVIDHGMPSDTPVQVELELLDPGSNAVNFEFDFFRPS